MTKKITLRRSVLIFVTMSLVLLLTACGQKGPLYLPKNSQAQQIISELNHILPL